MTECALLCIPGLAERIVRLLNEEAGRERLQHAQVPQERTLTIRRAPVTIGYGRAALIPWTR